MTATWNDGSEDRDEVIAAHAIAVVALGLLAVVTSDDYHRDFAYISLAALLIHAFLFRIPHSLSHWVELAFVGLESGFVMLEVWAATSH